MLKEKPKFTDYFCYMFFMGSIVVGPNIEFRTFSDWIHLRGKYEEIPQWG
jgi:D-alanyl-lipoteichoic acid acyltransferase DltB (MBOAT superfamily)